MSEEAHMGRYYLLKDRKILVCDDVLEWGKKFEKADRIICQTNVKGHKVSTVFLGIDHGFSGDGESMPVLFETMIFEPNTYHDIFQARYCTLEGAETGHLTAISSFLDPYMEGMGMKVEVVKHPGNYQLGYGVAKHLEYHKKLLELYTKLYPTGPKVWISIHERLVIPDYSQAQVKDNVEDNAVNHRIYAESYFIDDTISVIDTLENLGILYPYKKWEEEHG